jgi:hypothetical protein
MLQVCGSSAVREIFHWTALKVTKMSEPFLIDTSSALTERTSSGLF